MGGRLVDGLAIFVGVIIDQEHLYFVDKMLDAAALTYVAATLQAVMVLLHLIIRFGGGGRRE
jgi:uncharacterized protein